ncbi:MAG: SDR family oxidoreductase [Rhodospirillales bacterium]|nr:SDR family oxidoreductase [Rhodospirillales bacterium]
MTNSLFNLDGKVAVVTGSSRGIGRAIAERLAEAGASVVVSSRKPEACEPVATAIRDAGGKAHVQVCNISDRDHCEALVQSAHDTYGGLDIVVCNAASNPYYGPLLEIPDAAYEKIMGNNVRSNLWLAQAAMPGMAKTGGGSVIVISSIAGLQGVHNLGAYAISKSADLGLIRSLAMEGGPHNIRVNALCPGIIKTAFARALWENPDILKDVESNAPLGRIGVPDEVAGVAVMLAAPAGAFITGQHITMDGGVTMAGRG